MKNPVYYVMACRGLYPVSTIFDEPFLDSTPWISGEFITDDVPQPLEYSLDPDRPGPLRPMYDAASAPLFSADLLAALQDAGVDNLQIYDAVLADLTTGVKHTNYKAVNIVGIIAAADLGASTLARPDEQPLIDADFDDLVIDEAKPHGALLFRLAESASTIIVHDTVRRAVEARGVQGMDFFQPNEELAEEAEDE